MSTDELRLHDELARIDALLPTFAEEDVSEALILSTLERVADEPFMAPRVADEPPMAPRVANEPPGPGRWPRLKWAAALLAVMVSGTWMVLQQAPREQLVASRAPAEESVPAEEWGHRAAEDQSQKERVRQAIAEKLKQERAELAASSDSESRAVHVADRLVPVRPDNSEAAVRYRRQRTPGSSVTGASSDGQGLAERSSPRAAADPYWSSPEATPPPEAGRYPRGPQSAGGPQGGTGLNSVALDSAGGGYRNKRGNRWETASGERYQPTAPSSWKAVAQQPLSTLSIDVDTASYTNVRRFLRAGQMPPPDAVRIEELLNWFKYEDPAPSLDSTPPFGLTAEVAPAPWNGDHLLVRLAMRAATIPPGEVPPRNLVFLVDVSGSMKREDKLPLLQRAMTLLAGGLRDEDSLAIVTYAGRSEVALPTTSGRNRSAILAAIDGLTAGGSTNGEGGLRAAYKLARFSFEEDGINRVILATDGDFNVGIRDRDRLISLIEQERESGVFLTALGFGTGNLRDDNLEALADHGNGNYAYIDGLEEAHKVLTAEGGGKLVTLAKDVKLQVEFNPAQVEGWRLLGYENRVMSAREFRDDKKDAGELQAGDGVTALFEIVPAGGEVPEQPLRYQQEAPRLSEAAHRGELMVVHARWKRPQGARAKETSFVVEGKRRGLWRSTDDFRTSAAVAGWAMLLRGDGATGAWRYSDAIRLARDAQGADPDGQRAELLELMKQSASLSGR